MSAKQSATQKCEIRMSIWPRKEIVLKFISYYSSKMKLYLGTYSYISAKQGAIRKRGVIAIDCS
jgi:hypothetical protein